MKSSFFRWNPMALFFFAIVSVAFIPNHCFSAYYFGENKRIHDDPNFLQQFKYGSERSLAYANGAIFAAWADGYGEWKANLYVAKSTDGGKTFSSPVKANDTPSYDQVAVMSIATDKTGQYIYVIWHTYRQNGTPNIYIARSVDGGKTFERNMRVDTSSLYIYQQWNSVTVDNEGNVYVVWEERGGYDSPLGIFMAKSVDKGATFRPKVRVSPILPAYWQYVTMNDVVVDDAGNIYVAWMDGWGDHSKIHVSVSTDGGSSFNEHTIVDNSSDPQYYPQIIARGNGEVWVAWQDWRKFPKPYVFVAHSTDRGKTFSQAVKAADVSCSTPNMTQGKDGDIFIACVGATDVYMTWSEDDGASFKPTIKVTDHPLTFTYPTDRFTGWPSIAVSEQNQVFVAWTDTRNGNYDIYFAASNIPNQSPIADAGRDQVIECAGPTGSLAALNASGTSDPDGDSLTYAWTWNGGTAEGVNPSVTLPLGTTTITLTVSDGKSSATDAVNVTIRDTTPPVTSATGGADTWYNANVISAFTSYDICAGVNKIHYSVNGHETIVQGDSTSLTIGSDGVHEITYFAVDNAGNVESPKNMKVMIDKTPPVLNLASGQSILWPPDHKMVDVNIMGGASDGTSGLSSVTFAVTDEYGKVEPEITGFYQSAPLEAWREGKDMDGRHYTITAIATDAAGNKTTSSVTVLVPHDQRN